MATANPAGTAAIGSYPAGAYGLFDMAGNVWEFVSDWYADDFYEGTQGAVDPENVGPLTDRGLRGDSPGR